MPSSPRKSFLSCVGAFGLTGKTWNVFAHPKIHWDGSQWFYWIHLYVSFAYLLYNIHGLFVSIIQEESSMYDITGD
jgi:hypothetical protein